MRIYTLWARLPNDEGAWMIAAEDEWSWEGNPDRCRASFHLARSNAEREGNAVREIELLVDQEQIEAAFRPVEVGATVSLSAETDDA